MQWAWIAMGRAIYRVGAGGRAALVASCAALAGGAVCITSSPAVAAQPAVVVESAEKAAEATEDARLSTVRPRWAAPIKHLKKLIAHIRESIKYTQTLPHTTVLWQVHLPKKRQHIKELQERIQELWVRAEQAHT